MPIRTPPRREPRVLSVAAFRHGLLFAVVDPWEVRSVGFVTCACSSRLTEVKRLISREKPSALVGTRRLRPALLEAGAASRLGVVKRDLPTLPLPIARDLYPEIGIMAPKRAAQRVAVRAIAAVLHANIPTRHYATRRQ